MKTKLCQVTLDSIFRSYVLSLCFIQVFRVYLPMASYEIIQSILLIVIDFFSVSVKLSIRFVIVLVGFSA